MADYSNVSFKNNGKLKLLIIVGTRPEIIRLAAVINKTRKYFDVILAHTGQNYDYNLNGVFFHDLQLSDPEVYMNAVGADLGETMGNIISESYKLMVAIQPDAVLVLGDTNSCLSVIGAKRLHIPIFHMEAGNRCKDECLPEETNRRIVDIISDVNMAYSEHARRYLADTGLPKERTYVTGSPWQRCCTRILRKLKPPIFTPTWDSPRATISFCLPTVKKTSIRRRTSPLCSTLSTKWRRSMICLFYTPAIPVAVSVWSRAVSSLTSVLFSMSLWGSMITTASR